MFQGIRDTFLFLNETPSFLYPLLFVFGAIVGSFLNVCIYRLPNEDMSVVKPRSFCPSCKQPIAWYDNIPFISYMMLRGKCRICQARISFRYCLIEFVTGISFMIFVWRFGFSPTALCLLYLFCSLLVASLIDFKFKIIPDEITFYGMLTGLLLSYLFPELQGERDPRLGIADSILGLLLGGAVIYGIAIIGDFLFKKESMGGGDIKLLAMIGAFVGPKLVVFSFFLSPYFAIFVALYYKFFKKEETIPYGPFLSMGAVAALFFGDQLLQFIGV